MAIKQVVPGLHQVSLGIANAYLFDDEGDLTLVDTGTAGSAERILAGVRELGKQPQDLRRILVTHLHADHTGSLAELKRRTGAQVYMHPADAERVRQGIASRPCVPAPGHIKGVLVRASMRGVARVEPAETDVAIEDGQELPVAGGLVVISAAGHTAGQVVFLWPRHGGVLIAGDAVSHLFGRLDLPMLFEDMALGMRDLQKLAALDFRVAVFGHGGPILEAASGQFRAKWGR